MQFHAVAFIARSIESAEQFYLACTVKGDLYAMCNKRSQVAKFECNFRNINICKICLCLSIIYLFMVIYNVIESVL